MGSEPATVHAAFEASAARHGPRPFLHVVEDTARAYGIEARSYVYDEVRETVAALSRRYRLAGFGHGHRAGLLLENRPAFFFHWLALNALGVSVVPISAEWRADELAYLIGHSEIDLAVALPSRIDELAAAAGRAGRRVVLATEDGTGLDGPARSAPHGDRGPDRRSECALLYTSGTTGRPKGCVLSNEYYLWAGEWYAGLGGLCALREGCERLVTPLPLNHMNAMACSTMAMIRVGGCVVQLDRFHARSWWDSVRESGATIVHYLGVMPAMLLGAPPSPRDRDHSVRFGFGAGVNPVHHAAFEERFGFPLIEAWAMTETGVGAAIIANREPRKIGTACFGRPAPRVEVRIVDEEGRDVPPGTPGELLVRSAGENPRFGFFTEYLKDPGATAEAWRDGYFRTGDVVVADADGDLHFVDRRKNVIRRSGENIAAVEVEGALAQHPAVAAAGVAAVPDELRGEEVMACIVPREAVAEPRRVELAHELVRFCLGRLAYFKAPGYVAFCDRLPLTPTEKLQRAALKALAQSLLAEGRCIDTRPLKRRQNGR